MLSRTLTIASLVVLLASYSLPAQEKAFRAGASAIDITPRRLPVSMTGSFQDRAATSAHDKLHARCVVLDDSHTRIAIVVCDICLISREIFDAAKEIATKSTGIPANRMLMSATHTHTAPTVVALAQCHPDPNYVEQLIKQIAQSVETANKRLKPASVGWAVGREPAEVNNRRWFVKPEGITPNPFGQTTDKVRMNPPRGSDILVKPAGPIDPEVAILSVQSRDKRPMALFANYSLHYVGGIPPNQLSADYFGEFARQIGRRLNADSSFVGAMTNGTSGDVNNYNFLKPRPRAEPFERVQAVANRIADVAHTSHKSIKHSDKVTIKMVERTIDLGVRRPDAEELRQVTKTLEQAKDPKRLNTAELYAQSSVRLSKYPEQVNVKLQALRIGDLGIVAIPCEVFAEIGLELKSKSPLKPMFSISLANGYNGYLPSPEQHALGGYETWRSGWSYLEVDASTKITKNLLEMLNEVAN